MNQKKIVIILGMHRSGTSSVASILSAFNADFGKKILPANEYNQAGYFENASIVDINERILFKSGLDWSSLIISDILPDNQIKEESIKTINTEFKENLCVIKDPRLSRIAIHKFWHQILNECQVTENNIFYILVNRHPECVSQSLKRRDGLPIDFSKYLWLFHQYEALKTISKTKHRSIIINFDDLFFKDERDKVITKLSMLLKTQPKSNPKIDRSLKNFNPDGYQSKTDIDSLYYTIKDICLPYHDHEKIEVAIKKIESILSKEEKKIKLANNINEFNILKKIELKNQIKTKEKQIRRLNSHIDWMQNRRIYKIYRYFKSKNIKL